MLPASFRVGQTRIYSVTLSSVSLEQVTESISNGWLNMM